MPAKPGASAVNHLCVALCYDDPPTPSSRARTWLVFGRTEFAVGCLRRTPAVPISPGTSGDVGEPAHGGESLACVSASAAVMDRSLDHFSRADLRDLVGHYERQSFPGAGAFAESPGGVAAGRVRWR